MDLLAEAAEKVASVGSPTRSLKPPPAENGTALPGPPPSIISPRNMFVSGGSNYIFIPCKGKNPKAIQITASGRSGVVKLPLSPNLNPNKGSLGTKVPPRVVAPVPVYIELPVATFAGIPPELFRNRAPYFHVQTNPAVAQNVESNPDSAVKLKKKQIPRPPYTTKKRRAEQQKALQQQEQQSREPTKEIETSVEVEKDDDWVGDNATNSLGRGSKRRARRVAIDYKLMDAGYD